MFREGLRPPNPFRERSPLERLCSQDGMSLVTLSGLTPVLVICLPTLQKKECGGLLAGISAARATVETAGVRVALIHMEPETEAVAAFAVHDLQYVVRIHDPQRELYGVFELGETTVRRLLILSSEPQQLPGAVLLRDGEVCAAIRPTRFAQDLDYVSLLP